MTVKSKNYNDNCINKLFKALSVIQATALTQTICSTNKLRSPTLKFDILLYVTSVEDFGLTSKGRRKQSENPQLKGKDVMLVIVFVVCSLITSLA